MKVIKEKKVKKKKNCLFSLFFLPGVRDFFLLIQGEIYGAQGQLQHNV